MRNARPGNRVGETVKNYEVPVMPPQTLPKPTQGEEPRWPDIPDWNTPAPEARTGKTDSPENSMFDTLKISKDLETAGVERKQAEAHTSAIASIVTDMPTKADIEVMRVGIETLRDTVKDYKDSTGRHLSIITTLIVLILASILGYAFGLLPADRQNTPAPAVQYVPAPAPAADPPAPLTVDAE